MKLSDYVIQFIEALKVRHVFMVPGGGAMHLNDSLGQSKSLTWICNLHEQASAMCAETYAKATENIGVAMFTLAGLLTAKTLWLALLPAGLYFVIHLVEGEIITPTLLARRFTLNRVLVILALIFWYWMWGVPGAILSTPMLAITKIVCDRIQALASFGHFIEG